MKKLITLSVALAFAACVYAQNVYVTKSAAAPQSGGTTNIWPAVASKQVRCVQSFVWGDTNNCLLTFRSGGAAYRLTQTNASSATTLTLDRTNGITRGDYVIIQTAAGDVAYRQVLSYGSGTTNIVLTNAVGLHGRIGDTVYHVPTSGDVTFNIGATTNVMNGEAIYSADHGRPVVVTCGPALVTNRQVSMTVRYD